MPRPRILQSFSSRGTALVMALLLVFSLVLGIVSYRAVAGVIEAEAADALSALATTKKHALEAQVSRYFEIIQGFTLPGQLESVADLVASQGSVRESLREAMEQRLRLQLQTSALLTCAQIVTPGLNSIARTDPEHGSHLEEDPLLLQEAHQRPSISPPYRDGDRYFLNLAAPLMDSNGDLIAILVVRTRADNLLAILGDHVGLGQTGETVLGRRVGDELEFLAPLRFQADPDAVPTAAITGARAGPMINATAGQAGMSMGLLDYRDIPVAAAYRPVTGTNWGMVVKQDMSEIFSPVRAIRSNLIMAILAILGIGALTVYPALRMLTLPLRTLREATERVAHGILDTKMDETGDTETSALAASFNRMVANLNESREASERRNEELKEFAYVVSHDLKAPLRGIAGISQWLQEDLTGKVEPESLRHLELMRDRVLRMDALINGLLDYSRVGRVSEDPMEIDVGALVRRVVDDMAPPEGFSVVQLSAFPTVRAEPIRLAQIFQNLIGNAIQHHPAEKGRIRVDARDAGLFWEFSIQDDGMGIDPRYHGRIFSIFSKLSAEGDAESTGIGLAIVKKIVEDVGGRVWVESTGVPGQGSDFHFTWPKTDSRER